MDTTRKPARLTRMERDDRDDRILHYRLDDGLTLAEIAGIEKIEPSTVLRSLRRTERRWRTNPLDIGTTLRTSLQRLQAVSHAGMREATFEKDPRTKMSCYRTVALAEAVQHRLLLMLGLINPDALPVGHDPEHATASDIRRLAEEVTRAGVRMLPPTDAELISDGERQWLEGETVEADPAPVGNVTPAAPAPTPAPTVECAGPTVQPTARVESTANAMTAGTDGRRDRLTAMQRVAPPGER